MSLEVGSQTGENEVLVMCQLSMTKEQTTET